MSTDNLPKTVSADPIADPGLPAHEYRPTDVDPAAEKRAERQVAMLFTLSMVCAVLFVVSYLTFDIGEDPDLFLGLGTSNLTLGLTLAGTFLFIGVGVIQWARKLMSDHEIVEERHAAASSESDRTATLAALKQGAADSGIGRRPLIRNTLLGALGLSALPLILPLRDLGPLPGDKLDHTLWDIDHFTEAEQAWWDAQGRQYQRIVRDVTGSPIEVARLEVGDLVNAEPEILFAKDEHGLPVIEGGELQVAKTKCPVIVLRMEPDDIIPGKGREDWSFQGIVAYSKVCTHVGCPISLNERTTHHLLCPCHQSTFDLADSGKVVFGPAARALPQLPVAVDDDGYLVAQSDFTEPVGPSFWERDSQ